MTLVDLSGGDTALCRQLRNISIWNESVDEPWSFQKLSFEIRHQVWECVCSEISPRTVTLWMVETEVEKGVKGQRGEPYDVGSAPYFYATHSEVPPVLHTCHESRIVALKYYSLEFGSEWESHCGGNDGAVVKKSTPPRIFVNWERDIICPMAYHDTPRLGFRLINDLISKHPTMRRIALEDEAFFDSHSPTQGFTNWIEDLGCDNVDIHVSDVIIYCWPSPVPAPAMPLRALAQRPPPLRPAPSEKVILQLVVLSEETLDGLAIAGIEPEHARNEMLLAKMFCDSRCYEQQLEAIRAGRRIVVPWSKLMLMRVIPEEA